MKHPNASATTPNLQIPVIAVPLLSLAAFGSGISLRVTDPLLPQLAKDFSVADVAAVDNVVTPAQE